MVVQFGLATMPFGRWSSACGFTSATTSGTSGSIRHADELSMTVTPAAATRGAERTRAVAAGREQRDVEPGRIGDVGVLDGDLRRRSTAACARPNGPRRSTAARRRGSGGRRGSPASRCRPGRWRRRHLHAWAKGYRRPSGATPQFRRLRRRARTRCAAPAPTARRRRRRRRSEMRIVDVEIISMLTPSFASVSNIFAATPGLVFMPAPIERDPADVVVVGDAARADLGDELTGHRSLATSGPPWAP